MLQKALVPYLDAIWQAGCCRIRGLFSTELQELAQPMLQEMRAGDNGAPRSWGSKDKDDPSQELARVLSWNTKSSGIWHTKVKIPFPGSISTILSSFFVIRISQAYIYLRLPRLEPPPFLGLPRLPSSFRPPSMLLKSRNLVGIPAPAMTSICLCASHFYPLSSINKTGPSSLTLKRIVRPIWIKNDTMFWRL